MKIVQSTLYTQEKQNFSLNKNKNGSSNESMFHIATHTTSLIMLLNFNYFFYYSTAGSFHMQFITAEASK